MGLRFRVGPEEARGPEKAGKRPRKPEKARRGQKRLGRGKRGCSVGLLCGVDP